MSDRHLQEVLSPSFTPTPGYQRVSAAACFSREEIDEFSIYWNYSLGSSGDNERTNEALPPLKLSVQTSGMSKL